MNIKEFRQNVRRITFTTYAHEEDAEEIVEMLKIWWSECEHPMYRCMTEVQEVSKRELPKSELEVVWACVDPTTFREAQEEAVS